MSEAITKREFLKLMGVSGAMALSAGALSFSAMGGISLPPGIDTADQDKYGIIILADGLRLDLFLEMLKAGKLPNIKDRLVDRGTMAECVSVLPSTTGPAHLSFLTGTFPGRNDVPGIRWMDRVSRICRNYCSGLEGVLIGKDHGLKTKTIFEVLSAEKTAAIYEFVNKGATHIVRPNVKEAWWMRQAEWERFDEKAADLVEECYDRHLPRFTFVWMPGVDHLSHFEGPMSEKVQGALVNVDKQIGRIANVLEKHGIYDKTLIGLVSDHGLRDTNVNLNLSGNLKLCGLMVKPEGDSEGDWKNIHRYNAVVAVSGNAFAHVYLCDDEGRLEKEISIHDWFWEPKIEHRHPLHGYRWTKPVNYNSIRKFPIGNKKNVDLIEAILDHRGFKLIFTPEKWGRYLIFSSSGQSAIDWDPSVGYKYSIIQGDDPLGYADFPDTAVIMDGEFHTGDEWLKAGNASAHPDALTQICQIFKSKRCGDMIVLATSGYDLMNEAHIGSHGGIEREEILTPAVLAGPGIVKKRLECVRTVDIFPTYLRFFGINPAPLEIDAFLTATVL